MSTKMFILLEDRMQAHCCRYWWRKAEAQEEYHTDGAADNIGIMEVQSRHIQGMWALVPLGNFPYILLYNLMYMISDTRSSYFVQMGSTKVSNSTHRKGESW